MATQDDFTRITLRIPPELYSKLRKSAGVIRSINAEIIERLDRSYREYDLSSAAAASYLLDPMAEQIKKEVLAATLAELARMRAADEALLSAGKPVHRRWPKDQEPK